MHPFRMSLVVFRAAVNTLWPRRPKICWIDAVHYDSSMSTRLIPYISLLLTHASQLIHIKHGTGRKWHTSNLVRWSLTYLFSTNMAISETKGQGWKVIRTQW